MFDVFIDYKIKEEELKRLKIKTLNSQIKKNLKFNKNDIVFFKPKNEKDLSDAVKRMLPFGIIDSELIHKKESLHYSRSGIDDTTGKMMGKKKIAIVFNLSLLLKNTGIKRAMIIRRMRENMRRAIKYNIPVVFASLAKNKYECFNGMQIKTIAKYLNIDSFKRVKESFYKIKEMSKK